MSRTPFKPQPSQGTAQYPPYPQPSPLPPAQPQEGQQVVPFSPAPSNKQTTSGAALIGPQGRIELSSFILGVGRSPANQLKVNDPEVSWFHAQISPQGPSHIIIDLRSRNGTFVNGQKLLPYTPHQLTSGDTVRFGNTQFSYLADISSPPLTKAEVTVPMTIVESFQPQQPSVHPQWGQTTQLLANKLVALLQSSTSQSTSNDRPSASRLQASLLLYVAVIGVIGCIGGIALDRYHILPTDVTNIATAVSAFMTLLAGSWTILAKLFPKDVWRNARKLPVVVACLVTVGILLIPTLRLYSLTDDYIHQGILTFEDPLASYTKSSDWYNFHDDTGGACQFKNTAYYASQELNKQFSGPICVAQVKNFHDLVYEVEMAIIQGDAGGIVFRDSVTNDTYYEFTIDHTGQYNLWRYNGQANDKWQSLAEGEAPSIIHTGYNQRNLIAVVVQGSRINLYVNHQLLAPVLDSALSTGRIGVAASSTDHSTEVEFHNARVWTLP